MPQFCKDETHRFPSKELTREESELIFKRFGLLADILMPQDSLVGIKIYGNRGAQSAAGIQVSCIAFDLSKTEAGNILAKSLTKIIQPSQFFTYRNYSLLERYHLADKHRLSAHKQMDMIQSVSSILPPEDPIWTIPEAFLRHQHHRNESFITMTTTTDILPWTQDVQDQALKNMHLLFAAILAPNEEIYVELKGLISPSLGDRSKFMGSFNEPNRTLSDVANLCSWVVQPENYRPENNLDGKRWNFDLCKQTFSAQNYSAHQALEAKKKLPRFLREMGAGTGVRGADQHQLDLWLAMIP